MCDPCLIGMLLYIRHFNCEWGPTDIEVVEGVFQAQGNAIYKKWNAQQKLYKKKNKCKQGMTQLV